MTRVPQLTFRSAAVLLVCTLAGCASFHFPFEKRIPKATAADPVVQILCLWQQAEGRDPDGYPCKGFSGQILFLSNRAATPVQIEGDVRIYLFDDQGTEEEQTKPLRQFDFDNGSWSVHLAETSLGPTYSVFVPYVRRGTKDANCALRIRLKPKVGPTIFSDLSNMPLNGSKKIWSGEEAKPITPDENDRLAAEAMAGSLRRTTTISMGSNPKTTESAKVARKDESAGQVKLASHEVTTDASADSGDADRIRRLEAMVQQLLEQQSNPRPVPAVAPADPPRRRIDQLGLDDEPDGGNPPPGRLKLSARRTIPPTDGEFDDEEGEVILPIEPEHRKHPLDD